MEKIEVDETVYNSHKNKKNNGIILFIIIISFCIGLWTMYYYNHNNSKVITKEINTSKIKVSEEAMEDAINKVYDSVMCIQVLDSSGTVISTGTGFVYNKDDNYGYVLTNAHVVSGGSSIVGILTNDKQVDLTLLGFDTYTDLAVLKMPVKSVIQVASIGTSSNIKVGNTVFTIGCPMGATYAGTVTKGILSGKDRLIETSVSTYSNQAYIVKVLQTDAALSPGNSGGPLVDLAGDVIGITSLKLVASSVEGMGFAIPIEDAMEYVSLLEKGQTIQRPLLGVQLFDLTNKNNAYKYGMNVDTTLESGVVLAKVTVGYPAAKAGLKVGDIVTKIANASVTTVAEFKYQLFKYKVGDTIEITYYRNGTKQTTKVTLDKSTE